MKRTRQLKRHVRHARETDRISQYCFCFPDDEDKVCERRESRAGVRVPHRAMRRSRTCAGLTRGRTFSSSPIVFVHARQKSRWTSLRRKVLAGTPSRTTKLVTGRTRTAASTGAQASRSATAVRESIAGEYREDRMSVRDARVGRAVDNGSRRGLVVTLEKRAFSRSGRFRRLRRRIFPSTHSCARAAIMPLLRPPRSEWDLLSNTKKDAPVPPGFFVPVEEENPIGVAQTGLKQLGGVVKCVHSAR